MQYLIGMIYDLNANGLNLEDIVKYKWTHIYLFLHLRNHHLKIVGQGKNINMAFKLNGNPLAVDVAFSHNDIQYPANWLRLSTAQEKKILVLLRLLMIQYMMVVFIMVTDLQNHL